MIKKVVISIFIFLFAITDVDAMTFSDYLVTKANNKSITTYEGGTKSEMYTFEHDKTSQLDKVTDYRYIGDNPNNYVYFNCTNEDLSSCEVWRIIGVFDVDDGNGKIEQRVKLIRGKSLSMIQSWNAIGLSEWSGSTLKKNLNEGDYYTSLSDSAHLMMSDAKYYLGGGNYDSKTHFGNGSDIYKWEREKNVYGSNSVYWNGRIALMYLSDYVYTYALGVDNQCYDDGYYCEKGKPDKGWIFNSNINDGSTYLTTEWTLSPYEPFMNYAYNIYASGKLFYTSVSTAYAIRPVVYLRNDIYWSDGNGDESNPYQLSLTKKVEDDDSEKVKDDQEENDSNTDDKVVSDNNQETNKPVENPSTGINNPYINLLLICGISILIMFCIRKKRFI